MFRPLFNQKGITVRNLLVLLSLIGALVGSALLFSSPDSAPRPDTPQREESFSTQRQALQQLAGDLRTLSTSLAHAPATSGLISADATHLTFRVNPPGEMAETLDPRLTYIFSAGNLVRNDGSFARILAADIDFLEFSYILADGRRSAAPHAREFKDIRAVEVTLIAPTHQATPAPARRVFRLPSGATFTAPAKGPPRRMLSTTVNLRVAHP
ncbi:hypothetical protein SAMN05660860_03428 [Geoalkalibacter ferrihydriticus]|uniref:Uncharacterized protein n=2 Tax=Geoalkalibacter ferrihydriticus TaxID=392333 RepID=A0A0C2EA24_9BACT|nr:hypothetical protein [Geoalkalibacter ferrihydriticus]KIH75443.1 hypothetical protein GFER_16835 [Geoalkalibacter ferrihydriticus DSM 17813]SDM93631.1 hypothetical protein SAMN05660860_03428 [Geoalkalibacter ferrihydriticus]